MVWSIVCPVETDSMIQAAYKLAKLDEFVHPAISGNGAMHVLQVFREATRRPWLVTVDSGITDWRQLVLESPEKAMFCHCREWYN